MANSADPDQNAPERSELGLYCLHMPFCQKLWFYDILRHLFQLALHGPVNTVKVMSNRFVNLLTLFPGQA